MSLENLSELAASPEDQQRLRDLLEGHLDPESFASVQAWLGQCHHRPSDTELVMEACNEILEGFGREALEGPYVDRHHGSTQASYINMGDCYTLTIIRDHVRSQWLITTVGDLVETEPDRFR